MTNAMELRKRAAVLQMVTSPVEIGLLVSHACGGSMVSSDRLNVPAIDTFSH